MHDYGFTAIDSRCGELKSKLEVRTAAFYASLSNSNRGCGSESRTMAEIITDAELITTFLLGDSDLPETPPTEESRIKSIAEELRNSIPAFLAAASERMGGGDDLNDSCPDKEEV